MMRLPSFIILQSEAVPLEVFLGKHVLKICSKFTGEHPCQSVISLKFLCNFIETTLRHGCSPVNLRHIFRTPFPKNTLCRATSVQYISLSLYFNLSLINPVTPCVH